MAVGQTLKVVSTVGDEPVPFAALKAEHNGKRCVVKLTDAYGMVNWNGALIDSLAYTVNVKSVGFLPFTQRLTGAELKTLSRIRLHPDSVQLTEIVVTAQYAPVPVHQTVQTVRVIDREKMERMGAVNLRDVLTHQLNARIEQDNILGAGMRFQGISGENVKVLIDGVPVIGRLNGNVDLSQLNLSNVERIEITEGPLSVQYGTNALAGTINLITSKPLQKKYKVGTSMWYESTGQYNATLNGSVASGRHFVQFLGGRNYFDGWNAGETPFTFPVSQVADSTRYKQWKPKEQYFAGLEGRCGLKRLSADFKTAWFTETITNRAYPRAPYGESSFDDYYYTRRLDNAVALNGAMSPEWSVSSVSAFNVYRRIKKTVYKDLTTLDEMLSANPGDQDTTGFHLWMSRASFIRKKEAAVFNYELGYDVNYESASGKRIKEHVRYMGDYALFVTAECNLFRKLQLKGGARYAYNTRYQAPLIPSLNISYRPFPAHTIRAGYALGYRAPSIKELYFYFVDINHQIAGNDKLTAEKGNAITFNYQYTLKRHAFQFKYEAGGFYNAIRGLITLAQVQGMEYTYVNIGEYKTKGAQMQLQCQYKQTGLQLGAVYTGRSNVPESPMVKPFSYSPELNASLNHSLLKQGLTFSFFYKYNGKIAAFVQQGDAINQRLIQDYHTADFTVTKRFLSDRIHLVAGCKNILNVTSIQQTAGGGAHASGSTTLPVATGRNYFMKLTLTIEQWK